MADIKEEAKQAITQQSVINLRKIARMLEGERHKKAMDTIRNGDPDALINLVIQLAGIQGFARPASVPSLPIEDPKIETPTTGFGTGV